MIALSPGTVFAHDFLILAPLREGGMGSVYLVEQQSTRRRRALKLMHPQLARDPASRMRFQREACIGGGIGSEHVVDVVATGVDVGTGIPWLAMELLEGRDLLALVGERGALPAADVLAILRQLAHAMAAAHRAGVVHRDIKPDNVFVADSQRSDTPCTVKVLDFGISRWAQEAGDASSSEAAGTPLWLAPEQATVNGAIGPWTDVWSFGLLAFYLLVGRPFWRAAGIPGASVPAILTEVLLDRMPPASHRAAELGVHGVLSSSFDRWFSQVVEREPSQRIADVRVALDGLAEALAQPIPPPWGPFQKPASVDGTPSIGYPTEARSDTLPSFPYASPSPTLPAVVNPLERTLASRDRRHGAASPASASLVRWIACGLGVLALMGALGLAAMVLRHLGHRSIAPITMAASEGSPPSTGQAISEAERPRAR